MQTNGSEVRTAAVITRRPDGAGSKHCNVGLLLRDYTAPYPGKILSSPNKLFKCHPYFNPKQGFSFLNNNYFTFKGCR
jgi:hypothetical protein